MAHIFLALTHILRAIWEAAEVIIRSTRQAKFSFATLKSAFTVELPFDVILAILYVWLVFQPI